MIGNSPKSDMNPALEAGLNAVFVPHAHTWVLEKQELVPGNGKLITVDGFGELRNLFEKVLGAFTALCASAARRASSGTCRFFLRALRVVLGADRQVVLVHRALALAGDVEDLAQIDVRPDFGPLRLQVAVQRFAEFVRRRLIVVLQEVAPPRCGSAPASCCGWFPAPSGIPSAPRRIRSARRTARRGGWPPPRASACCSAARDCSGR